MSSPQEYADRINELGLEKLEVHINSVPEAKATTSQMRVLKKELQQIKKEISADIKAIRGAYQAQIPQAGSGGATVMRTLGAFGTKGMKGHAKEHEAAAKRQIKAKQDKALEPYEKLKFRVDSLISQLDVGLVKIEGYIQQNPGK